jgi:Zn-dependent protease
MSQQVLTALYTASTWVIPLVIAITFHEASHGYVARLCGDDTAWRLGRVSFNPFKHIDPFGTILLPAALLLMRSPILFGYAKPVPSTFKRCAIASRLDIGRRSWPSNEFCISNAGRTRGPRPHLFT